MSEPLREEHRGIAIRCGYFIETDTHKAFFELPAREGGFQRVIRSQLPLAPGPYVAEDKNPQRAIEQAKATIDEYFDG